MAYIQKSYQKKFGNKDNSMETNIIEDVTYLVEKANNTPAYKVYTALLTQSGTNAPVATVLENTIGEIEFVYDGEASYYINNENFIYTKTFVFINMTNDDGTSFRPCSTSLINGSIILYTESDDWTAKIEIRVYN